MNVVIVFLLCGLWHGANWTYVLWGLYAAFFSVLGALVSKPLGALLAKWKISPDNIVLTVLRLLLLYLVIIISSLIFRSADLHQAAAMLSTLFTGFGFGADYFKTSASILGIDALTAAQIVLCCACGVLIWHFAEIGRDTPEDLSGLSKREIKALGGHRLATTVLVALIVTVCWVALLGTGSTSAFQYFQF